MARVFVPYAIRHPRYLRAFPRLYSSFKVAKTLRDCTRTEDFSVPPFMILSLTSTCNLNCAGCYAKAAGIRDPAKGLDYEDWADIISQAKDLGVFGFVLAGGEPFMFPGILDLCEEFKDRLFIIVTNGTKLGASEIKRLKSLPNAIILVSLEGDEDMTCRRRGKGVFTKASNTLYELAKAGIVSGVSATITRDNYAYWMGQETIDSLIDHNIKVAAFMEYIPSCIGGDQSLMLTEDERTSFRERVLHLRENYPLYLIHSPGDEEFFGGCVSAGRGFAHVTPRGDLTPCPVSNVATHNLRKESLKEALKSPLFREIRQNDHLLETDGMPCALFAHPKEVDELAKRVGAYRT